MCIRDRYMGIALILISIVAVLGIACSIFFFVLYYNVDPELETKLASAEKVIRQVICNSTTKNKIQIHPVKKVVARTDGSLIISGESGIGKASDLGELEWKYDATSNEVFDDVNDDVSSTPYILVNADGKQDLRRLTSTGEAEWNQTLDSNFFWKILAQEEDCLMVSANTSSFSSTFQKYNSDRSSHWNKTIDSFLPNRAVFDPSQSLYFLAGSHLEEEYQHMTVMTLNKEGESNILISNQHHDNSHGMIVKDHTILLWYSNSTATSMVLYVGQTLKEREVLHGYSKLMKCISNKEKYYCLFGDNNSGAILRLETNLKVSWRYEIINYLPQGMELRENRIVGLFTKEGPGVDQVYLELDTFGRVLSYVQHKHNSKKLKFAQPQGSNEIYGLTSEESGKTQTYIFPRQLDLTAIDDYCQSQ
eukprot:TRINITY_DN1590_c0_g1_i1.p1 TRINITY_DN1590_c0_g1~~TRINITY_DN1590_c0_g1_i1.p1  ORF type:complete len:420 (+),score=47.99 TRINITY_DN1590_c0_g1_i1:175-1434(+)